MERPTLKAIILDFSSVNNVDITVVQHLIDVRNQLDRYTSPERVDWHFACINNRWTKRALASAGFGYHVPAEDNPIYRRWKPVFSVAEIGGNASAAAAAEYRENEMEIKRQRTLDVENGGKANGLAHEDTLAHDASSSNSNVITKQLSESKVYAKHTARHALVHSLHRPLFHIDLTSALQSAIANVEREDGMEVKGVGTGTH